MMMNYGRQTLAPARSRGVMLAYLKIDPRDRAREFPKSDKGLQKISRAELFARFAARRTELGVDFLTEHEAKKILEAAGEYFPREKLRDLLITFLGKRKRGRPTKAKK